MLVWRICRAPHAHEPLSGKGGSLASGRWHTRGRRIIYTSESLALAALETLVHTDRDLLPPDLVSLAIEIPDGVGRSEIDLKTLPPNWRRVPGQAILRAMGDRWLDMMATPVLRVPSAVIPKNANYLINPNHPDATKISLAEEEEFRLDPRLE